eukprot:TRINITY_DN21239_c0_g1_i1.p1 TRINITY_DN21239_c0_g1~~TRINITY_DN21239_c0_g1_i1.p1  ORF type:complete len:172 (+),score=27.09 TRINITY_DN21239_c0_g1_i1:3-518(+)
MRLLTKRTVVAFDAAAHKDVMECCWERRKGLTSALQNPWLGDEPWVETILGDYHNPCPTHPSGTFDVAFCFNTYHDPSPLARESMNRRIHSLLTATGRYIIADHSALSATPPDGLHRINETLVVSEIENAGFHLIESSPILRCPVDDKRFAGWVPTKQPHTDRFLLKFVKR